MRKKLSKETKPNQQNIIEFATNKQLGEAIKSVKEQSKKYTNSMVMSQNKDIVNYASVAKQTELLTDGVRSVGFNSINKSIVFKSAMMDSSTCLSVKPNERIIDNCNLISFADETSISGLTSDVNSNDPTKAINSVGVKEINDRITSNERNIDIQTQQLSQIAVSQIIIDPTTGKPTVNSYLNPFSPIMGYTETISTMIEKNNHQDERISEIEEINNEQFDRIVNVESVNEEQDGKIEVLNNFMKQIYQLMYPIGSIYITSDSSFNPDSKFGGIWNKLPDQSILINSSNASGKTVGSNYLNLTTSNLPSHSHSINVTTGTMSANNVGAVQDLLIYDSGDARGFGTAGNMSHVTYGTRTWQGTSGSNRSTRLEVNVQHTHKVIGDTGEVGEGVAIDLRPLRTEVNIWKKVFN